MLSSLHIRALILDLTVSDCGNEVIRCGNINQQLVISMIQLQYFQYAIAVCPHEEHEFAAMHSNDEWRSAYNLQQKIDGSC